MLPTVQLLRSLTLCFSYRVARLIFKIEVGQDFSCLPLSLSPTCGDYLTKLLLTCSEGGSCASMVWFCLESLVFYKVKIKDSCLFFPRH